MPRRSCARASTGARSCTPRRAAAARARPGRPRTAGQSSPAGSGGPRSTRERPRPGPTSVPTAAGGAAFHDILPPCSHPQRKKMSQNVLIRVNPLEYSRTRYQGASGDPFGWFAESGRPHDHVVPRTERTACFGPACRSDFGRRHRRSQWASRPRSRFHQGSRSPVRGLSPYTAVGRSVCARMTTRSAGHRGSIGVAALPGSWLVLRWLGYAWRPDVDYRANPEHGEDRP